MATHRTSTLALALLSTAGIAHAQSVTELLRGQFARYDGDRSDAMERREFPGSDGQFESMDADRDGKVTFKEYADSPVARRFAQATYQNEQEPRRRLTTQQLLLRRLRWVERFDQNGDNKLTPAEWTGTNLAFVTLDANGDGIIDRKDVAEARGQGAPPPADQVPWPDAKMLERKGLASVDDVLGALDRNKDGSLGAKEAARSPLAQVFATADENGDGVLGRAELNALLETAARRSRNSERARERPQAFRVPFSTWDKNDDGRLDTSEFERSNLFARIDADRDGAITENEVERYRRSIEGEGFVSRFDLNDDGRVTLAEFGGPSAAFRRMDRNGDGVVNARDR